MADTKTTDPAAADTPAVTFSSPFSSEGTTVVGTTSTDAVPRDRHGSDEWDASKVPPSRFQKRKGSIYSTPGSRDGHVDSNYAAKFHAKHAEKYSKAK